MGFSCNVFHDLRHVSFTVSDDIKFTLKTSQFFTHSFVVAVRNVPAVLCRKADHSIDMKQPSCVQEPVVGDGRTILSTRAALKIWILEGLGMRLKIDMMSSTVYLLKIRRNKNNYS